MKRGVLFVNLGYGDGECWLVGLRILSSPLQRAAVQIASIIAILTNRNKEFSFQEFHGEQTKLVK